MKSIKVKICLITALFVLMTAMLGAVIGLRVSALNRYVTLSGSSIFNTSGSAQVWAHRENRTITPEGGEETEDPWYFTMFALSGEDDAVTYRRNLAYEWFYNASGDINQEEESGEGEGETDAYVASERARGYFSLEIGFEALNFEKFTIAFETQQYNMTEDEKTVNTIVFVPVPVESGEPSKVYAVIINDENKKDAEKDAAELLPEDTSGLVELDPDHIVIEFGAADEGSALGTYKVTVRNVGQEAAEGQQGAFTNVGKTYAKYVSSSTSPVTPMTFTAKLPGVVTTAAGRARMAIYNLNGQSFALNRDEDGVEVSTSRVISEEKDTDGNVLYYTGGQVNDTVAPVLCLDRGVTFIKNGNEISFNYTAIDVLTQSPSTTLGYFMLTKEQAAQTEFRADDFDDDALFKTVTDSDDQYIFPHANHYVPQTGDYNAEVFGEKFNPVAAVKVYLKLTDTSSTGGRSTYVLMDWFVKDEYKITVNGNSYIAVAVDEEGATYSYDGADGKSWSAEADGVVATYQKSVDEAAKNLFAGADDFYLPSVENLFKDNATAYEDMTYSVYYLRNGSWQQQTSIAHSSLKIPLEDSGDYLFTVYANDAASNKMWYLDENDEVKEFTADDIKTMYKDEDGEGLSERLPWFTFTAGLADIKVDDPGEQSMAFVGTSYTADTFDIDGVSTETKYSLYRFENGLYFKDKGVYLTYDQFMETKADLFAEYDYFTEIPERSSLEEGSEEYDLYYDYAWNASSRSFVPQDENGFYLIVCEVTSKRNAESASGYMGIAAAAVPPAINGEDTWLQDNLTSIILLSIAGAALIGIILLLVIKPKEQVDIDEQFAAEQSLKSAKSDKSPKPKKK